MLAIFVALSASARIGDRLEDVKKTDFFTFFNPEIGNKNVGGNITSTTPYVQIQGAGNGNPAYYQFQITSAMLTPATGTIAGNPADTSSALCWRNGKSRVAASRMTMSRLGRARPNSRKHR